MADDPKKRPPLFSTSLDRVLGAADKAASGKPADISPPDERGVLDRLQDWWDPQGAAARAAQRKQPSRYRVSAAGGQAK